MIGQGVLLECLDSLLIDEVLLVNRQAGNIQHEKIKEVIHKDWSNFKTLEPQLKNYEACFFCLGISSAGLSEEKYKTITYDITINFAKSVLSANPNLKFCFISGAGTDSTEKGKVMWARIKGKAENDLLAMPFKDAYMFRPAMIEPRKGVKSKTKSYRVFYTLMTPFMPLLRPFKKIFTDTETLGKAMINAVVKGYHFKILESIDINNLGRS